MGPELMAKMREQAERFGTEIVDATVERVDFSQRPFALRDERRRVRRRGRVIVATGAARELLGLPSEQTLMGSASRRARPATASSSGASASSSSAAATPRWRRRPT